MKKEWKEYGITAYCGDCIDILPTLEKVDLVFTDPPYGIDYNNEKLNRKSNSKFRNIDGDKEFIFENIFKYGKEQIIFGAENFYKHLPHKGRWICWLKQPVGCKNLASDFEMAWVSKKNGYYKLYQIIHGGFINNDNPLSQRFHPTQKPVRLFQFILQDYSKLNDLVLDMFGGSGTTAIACIKENRRCIIIEKDKEYFDIMCQRIENAIVEKRSQLF